MRAFELASWSRPKVGPDIHVKVGPTLNSVPWALIGQHVDVHATSTAVQVFSDGRLVKTHVAAAGKGRVTDDADYPPEKIAFHMRTSTTLPGSWIAVGLPHGDNARARPWSSPAARAVSTSTEAPA